MASKKISMLSEKQYELEDLKKLIIRKCQDRGIDFEGEVLRELGETKTLLLIFERYYYRNGSYASLSILLSEFRGCQSADIISSGGKETLTSWGAEENFAKTGETVLGFLGFKKVIDNK